MREYIARNLLAGLLAGALTGIGSAPASATPAQPSYPDISQYQRIANLENFRLTDQPGRWFVTPVALHCAIEDDGSYGCSGDLRGAPAGENEVGWFAGDPSPRLYHTDEPRFGSGRAILTAKKYIEYRGTRCAVTDEGAAYCIHGTDPNSQIMVTWDTLLRGSNAAPSK